MPQLECKGDGYFGHLDLDSTPKKGAKIRAAKVLDDVNPIQAIIPAKKARVLDVDSTKIMAAKLPVKKAGKKKAPIMEYEVKTPIKAAKTPAKAAKTPVKTPAKAAKTPVKTPAKAARSSSKKEDSLNKDDFTAANKINFDNFEF